jgi:hypothetical protein
MPAFCDSGAASWRTEPSQHLDKKTKLFKLANAVFERMEELNNSRSPLIGITEVITHDTPARPPHDSAPNDDIARKCVI